MRARSAEHAPAARGRRRDALLGELARALGQLELEGARIAIAVSGGVDSTVLAHAFAALAGAHGLSLSIAHVNHGLRGAGSEADQRFAAELAARLGLAFATARVDPRAPISAAASSRARPTLQEAARHLRAAALRQLAAQLGAQRIATAHTADDQMETVLLRLLRGTGPAGLAGIPPRAADGLVVRPLLRVGRAEVMSFARARGISWREDPSNADPRFARSRLRREWLPGLRAAFNPRLLRAIGDLAEAQREESAWIEAWVEREAHHRFRADDRHPECLWIEAADWEPETTPDALARRLARLALHRCGAGRDVSRVHLDRLVSFLRKGRPGRAIELPRGLALAREARGFRLGRFTLPSARAC